MINLPKIENQAFKIQAAKQVYSKPIVLENQNKAVNSTYAW